MTSSSPSLKIFGLLWLAQFISLIGTDITKFALRVWTYQKYQSVTQFALVTFFTEMPSLLISPFAGAIVDRYDRKKIMIMSDLGSCASTMFLYYMFSVDQLTIHQIYVANAFGSVMNAFQWPAFTSSVILLVPKEKIAKFGGLNQAAPALSMLFAPMIAGYVVSNYGLSSAFAIEVVSFIMAFVVTSVTTIPNPITTEEGKKGKGSILSEIKSALQFINARPGLIFLLYLLANGHFSSGLVQVLMTPLILNFAKPSVLGQVLTVSGTGALFGSILLTLWGGPERKIFGVLGCAALQGLLLAMCGLRPNSYLILFVAFSYMFFIPLVRVCRESIWQRKVPPDMQGRVFALQRMIAEFSLPTAAIIAGPLADNVFEPLLAEHGSLASSVGKFIGTGPGRGVALLFIILGVVNVTVALLGFTIRSVRRIDIELKDIEIKSE